MIRRVHPVGLRGRLAISIAAIMLAVLGITFVATYRGTDSDLSSRIDSDLEREVDGLSRSLTSGPARTATEQRAQADRLILAQPFGPTSRVIAISIRGAGTATSQPELLGLPPLPGTGATGTDTTGNGAGGIGGDTSSPQENSEHGGSDDEQGGSDDHRSHSDDEASARALLTSRQGYSTISIEDVGDVRLLTRELGLPGGGQATIRVGQPLEPVQRALDGLSDTFLVVGSIGLVLAVAAGWLLASRTTGPMRKMAGVAEGVDGGELSARMPIEETRNDEVRRLAESFNHMLDRLEHAFTRQREFVGDASHDLRTPLTIVKGQLDVLARNPDPDAADIRRVADQVGMATDRMERLIDDLLLLARADSGAAMKAEPSEIGPLLAAEIEAFRAATNRSFEIEDRSARAVPLDRDQMSRAISNLLANAIAHTVEGGKIAVLSEDTADGIRVSIDDDGPGVPPDLRETVFDRFKRLDESRTSEKGGSGLGLAIVKAIAEAHGGRTRCGESPLGGARFSIDLPAAGSPGGQS